MSLISCPRCKHANPAGSRFCNVCGTALESAASGPGAGGGEAAAAAVPPAATEGPIPARQEELFADPPAAERSAPSAASPPTVHAPAFSVEFAQDGSVHLSVLQAGAAPPSTQLDAGAADDAEALGRATVGAPESPVGLDPFSVNHDAVGREPFIAGDGLVAPDASDPASGGTAHAAWLTAVPGEGGGPLAMSRESPLSRASRELDAAGGWRRPSRRVAASVAAAVLAVAGGAWWASRTGTPEGPADAFAGAGSVPTAGQGAAINRDTPLAGQPVQPARPAAAVGVAPVAVAPSTAATQPIDLVDRAPPSAGPAPPAVRAEHGARSGKSGQASSVRTAAEAKATKLVKPKHVTKAGASEASHAGRKTSTTRTAEAARPAVKNGTSAAKSASKATSKSAANPASKQPAASAKPASAKAKALTHCTANLVALGLCSHTPARPVPPR